MRKLISVLYSIYFNFRYLELTQAFKIPILIDFRTKVRIKRKSIVIKSSHIKPFQIKLGFNGSPFVSYGKESLIITNGGTLVFKGKAVIAEGQNLFVNTGKLTIENNFYANRNLMLQCENKISIGNDVLIGWDTSIRDTDGHRVNGSSDVSLPIRISDKAWIAAQVTILKGSMISSRSVVATGSIVTGLMMPKDKCLVAGIPAKIKKENVYILK